MVKEGVPVTTTVVFRIVGYIPLAACWNCVWERLACLYYCQLLWFCILVWGWGCKWFEMGTQVED